MFWFTPRPIPCDHPPHPALDLERRIARVFATLLHHLAFALPRLARFAAPAHTRLVRARDRLLSILSRLAEGTYPSPRPANPGAPKRKGGPPAPYLPRRRNWLGAAAGHEVRNVASQLAHLLNDPGTLHILATAPPHARAAFARALRGPARLLGLDLPTPLRPPPRPARPQEPPAARPPRPPRPRPAPIHPPIAPNILRAARYYRQRFGKDG
jgi:hypothetical protein